MSPFFSLLSSGWRGFIPLAAAGAIMIAAAAVYWFWGRDRRLSAVIPEGIPDGLTALEAGMAVDGTVQGEDVAAVLFDWAHRGYVTLRTDGQSWEILCGRAPEAAPAYEREAWDILFDRGRRQRVTLPENRGQLLMAASCLSRGAEGVFLSGPRRMTDSRSCYASVAVWIIGCALLLLAGVLAGVAMGLRPVAVAPVAIAAALPAVLAAWLSGWLQRYYQVRSRRRNLAVIGVILLCDLVMVLLVDSLLISRSTLSAWTLTPLVVTGIFCAMLAPLVSRRSRYGHELLCQLMGLRDQLTEEDTYPDRREQESLSAYYFRMLPYAWALGVSREFAGRFAHPLEGPLPGLEWTGEGVPDGEALWQVFLSIRDQLMRGQTRRESAQ